MNLKFLWHSFPLNEKANLWLQTHQYSGQRLSQKAVRAQRWKGRWTPQSHQVGGQHRQESYSSFTWEKMNLQWCKIFHILSDHIICKAQENKYFYSILNCILLLPINFIKYWISVWYSHIYVYFDHLYPYVTLHYTPLTSPLFPSYIYIHSSVGGHMASTISWLLWTVL